jgi:hypothetical protein
MNWRMRKFAINPDSNAEFRRAMIYDPGDGGVYVFLYRSPVDGPCDFDFWYENLSGAEHHVVTEFGGKSPDWQTIPDPLPECEHDWVAPMQAVRDERGRPVAGKFKAWVSD